jgi:hypothetical protein
MKGNMVDEFKRNYHLLVDPPPPDLPPPQLLPPPPLLPVLELELLREMVFSSFLWVNFFIFGKHS